MFARLLTCHELPPDGPCRTWRAEVEEDGRVWLVDAVLDPAGGFRFEWVREGAADPLLASRIKGHARRHVKWLLARELADAAVEEHVRARAARRSPRR